MDVEGMTAGNDERLKTETVRAVRAALLEFKHQLQRVRVELRSNGVDYTCKLHCRLLFWSVGGKTLVVKAYAASRSGAWRMATGTLKVTQAATDNAPVTPSSSQRSSASALRFVAAALAAIPKRNPQPERLAPVTPESRVLLLLDERDHDKYHRAWEAIAGDGRYGMNASRRWGPAKRVQLPEQDEVEVLSCGLE